MGVFLLTQGLQPIRGNAVFACVGFGAFGVEARASVSEVSGFGFGVEAFMGYAGRGCSKAGEPL